MKLLRNQAFVGALAVLAFGYAGWTILRPILGPRRYANNPPPAAAAAPASPAAVPGAASPAPAAGITVAMPGRGLDRPLVLARLLQWMEAPARDPFEAGPRIAAGPTGPKASDLLSLQAVLRQNGGRLAIINRTLVAEGDELVGYRVLRIEGDDVWVRGTNGAEKISFPVPSDASAAPTPAARPANPPPPAYPPVAS